VAFGDTLYRTIDAAETLKEQGYKVGVLNKPTLNVVDEEALKKIAGSGFVLVAETQNQVTGLGSPGFWNMATPRATSIWELPSREKVEDWNKWDSMVLSRNIWLRQSSSWFDKGFS
jgi:pyruvate/2-oxoglutarate/acetoin dehydrogenase E1 component